MKILINSRPWQTRIAQITSNKKIINLDFSNNDRVGSIYKGEVSKIVQSLEACFVNIGKNDEVFLHAKEIRSLQDPEKSLENKKTSRSHSFIQNKVQIGQKLMVQITKEEVKFKKARATTQISLAGPYLIYLPQGKGIRISRKIEDEKERQRITESIKEISFSGGVIVRTRAEGMQDFEDDLKHLCSNWRKIEKSRRRSVGLIYSDLPSELRILRDELSSLHSEVLIDDKDLYLKAREYIKEHIPKLFQKIKHYKDTEPLFEKFNIENKYQQILKRSIPLKSGGSIVIDENEALVSIDVNTGKFSGKKDQKEVVFKTNMEAVKEIAFQIRLRNLSGIIIIDLIDMEEEKSNRKIIQCFEKELKKDPVYTEVISLSSLGLIQMTRKRMKPSLDQTLRRVCPSCDGSGRIYSKDSISYEIFREVENFYSKELPGSKDSRKKRKIFDSFKNSRQTIQVTCHPEVVDWIQDRENLALKFLLKKRSLLLKFIEEPQMAPGDFKFKNLSKS